MYRCARIIHIFLSTIQYLLNLCGDPLHPPLTFSFCVYRNLQLNLLVVYGASDTCAQISKHRTRLCAPSCQGHLGARVEHSKICKSWTEKHENL